MTHEDTYDRETLPPSLDSRDTERAPADFPDGAPEWARMLLLEVRAIRNVGGLWDDARALAKEVEKMCTMVQRLSGDVTLLGRSLDGLRTEMRGSNADTVTRLQALEERVARLEAITEGGFAGK